jgi:hypothetical protein
MDKSDEGVLHKYTNEKSRMHFSLVVSIVATRLLLPAGESVPNTIP